MNESLLTAEQAAERLQLTPYTVRVQLRTGKLRGIKRGRTWRVPESALYEASPQAQINLKRMEAQAEAIWRDMTSGDERQRDAAIKTLAQAPAAVRAVVMQRSAEVAARYYATPEGEAELSDWRALDGEPFHDDAGDYYTAEEEARFRARREAAHSIR
jgi:excisionase family DNA binding protein